MLHIGLGWETNNKIYFGENNNFNIILSVSINFSLIKIFKPSIFWAELDPSIPSTTQMNLNPSRPSHLKLKLELLIFLSDDLFKPLV